MRALLLILLLSGPAAAKDPIMEALDDPAKVAELLKERKPKTAHLEAALKARNAETAKLLMKAGAKPPSADKARRELLDLAIGLDGETVRLLLAAGVPADVTPKGWFKSALTEASACRRGERADVLAALLDAGAVPPESGAWTPLGEAIEGQCLRHIALLLQRGAKTTATIYWRNLSPAAARLLLDGGYRPDEWYLKDAVLVADTDTVRLLLSTGAPPLPDPSYAHRGYRRALFELSAPDVALAKLVLPAGVAITVCEPGEDQSLLQRAAKLPDTTVLRHLLERFSSLSKTDWVCPADSGGPSPLRVAACQGTPEAVKALVDAGAKQGLALHEALRDHIAWERCPISGIKALVDAGVSVDTVDPTYGTPLAAALYQYRSNGKAPSMELVEILLAGKPKLRGLGLQSPLLEALRWPEVARRLVKAGADVNEIDADGRSLLFHVGTKHDHALAPAALALELGADPNHADKTGWTPLMHAASYGKAEIVSLLLKHGADPQPVEARGRTALQVALGSNQLEAAQVLRGVTKTAAAPPPVAHGAPAAPAPDVRQLVKQAVAEAREKDKPAPAPAAAAPLVSDVDKPAYSRPEDPDAYAMVVGVEEYSELPRASFAERDAAAVRRHFKALGVPDRNLILLSGQKAVRSALAKYLESWLPKNVSERSTVYFYFSGHGAPDPFTGKAFLMPWDGDPSFLADTAYPVDKLYKTLDALKAKQVLVALDACFSGAGGRSVLPEGARPLVTKLQKAEAGRVTVLSATQPDQITGVLKEQGHGIFTYYLLKGLSAGGTVTPESLYSYLKPKVEDEARRQNRGQSPSLSGPGGLILRK